MNPRPLLISIGLVFLACVSFPWQAWCYGDQFAIVIGNNHGDPSRSPLRYAEQDARKLHATLLQVGGFSEKNTRLLLGKNRKDILEAIQNIQPARPPFAKIFGKNKTGGSLILVYYSGHSENGSLELGSTRLSFQNLQREVRKLKGATTLFILDTCESGQMLLAKGGTTVPPISIPKADDQPPSGEIIMTSSAALEESFESPEIQGSFFTHFLVSGLRGAADFNLDGNVSLAEAYSYASRETRAVTSKLRHDQNPTLDIRLTGSGEIMLSTMGDPVPLLSLSPGEEGRFLILQKQTGVVVAEVHKEAGTSRHIAVPTGDLTIRKKKEGYFIEQDMTAQSGGFYEFTESGGQKVVLHSSRRIQSADTSTTYGKPVTLHEGEIVRLRLMDPISSKDNQEGDKIRLEASEDLFIDGRLAIAAGSPANGEVMAIRQKRGVVHAELVCRLGYVKAVDGQWVPLRSIVSRNPAGLKALGEGENVFSSSGSETETDIASGLTAFFFLPFYPLLKGRDAVLEAGTIFEAYVARDVKIR